MSFSSISPLCQLQTNEIEGRFLTASKDIQAGELILEEEPLVKCPPYTTQPLCLGCYKFLNSKNYIKCPKCSWPMCSKACSESPDHLLECQFLASCKVNPADFNFECEPLYDAITPLRMYGLKSQKPESWKVLMEMESHAKLWKKVPGWMEEHKPILDFLLKKVKAKGLDEDMICTLLGIGYTNDFSTDAGTGAKLRLTYAKTAMFSHDCSPNLVRYIDGVDANFTMKSYASRNITKGEKVCITYIDLLAPGPVRKDTLKKSKHFDCICQRCTDPTELDTFGGSIKCRLCKTTKNGFCSPPKWTCDNCKKSVDPQEAENILKSAYKVTENLLNNQSNWSVANYEKFLSDYKSILHPNNMCMIRIKNSLVGFYGRSAGYEVPSLMANPKLLERKIALAKNVLEVVGKIEPGISSVKGIILYELHMPIFLKAQISLSMGLVFPKDAKKEFKQAIKYIEKSSEHLKYEPEGSFGFQLNESTDASVEQLKNFVSRLTI